MAPDIDVLTCSKQPIIEFSFSGYDSVNVYGPVWDDFGAAFGAASVFGLMMGKKKSTSTENEGSGKPKATWLDEAFEELTGRDYDKRQLKNKWNSLKNDWKLWSSLLHKETGIGWDPARMTVDAPVEWWESKIQKRVPSCYSLSALTLKKRMELHVYSVRGSIALGHFVMIPLASIDIEEVVEDSEHNVISGDDEEIDQQGNECRGKKRTSVECQIGPNKEKKNKGVMGGPKRKKEKMGGASKLSKQIDRLVEVVESRSTTTYVRNTSTEQGTNIQEVMRVVATLPGAETSTKLW
ncbi:uncharacterized protein LOC133726250 [Rosa rugosa]|uniref:uncharacterized protein LOC133726250 n=1 Tax=Rosa rugosa TaxID=74645 RepID=UPI002B40D864|nr:uncharacterized protein LOC133726250 [Rosa rugosa]